MEVAEKISIAGVIYNRITDPETSEDLNEKIIAVDNKGHHFVLKGSARKDLKAHQQVSFFGITRVAGVNVIEEIKP